VCEYVLEFYLYKQKYTSASSWLFDFVSYFLARYKNENSCLSLTYRLRHFSTTVITKCGTKCERINHEEARNWRQVFVASFEIKRTYVLYRVSEQGSCHGLYRHKQVLHAIKPPCSDIQLKKHPVLFRQQTHRKTMINL